MKPFVMRVAFLAALWGVLIVGIAVFRIWRWQPEMRRCHSMGQGRDVLFIGDSHVGCSISTAPKFHNRVIWMGGLGHQFTYMRLLEMDRLGELDKVKTLVLEAGYPIFCEQEKDRLMRNWKTLLPLSWRYASLLPISRFELYVRLTSDVLDGIELIHDAPANFELLRQAQSWRAKNLKQEFDTHYGWMGHPDKMAIGWEVNLMTALQGIKSICHKKNIRLIFYSSPLSSFYRERITQRHEELFNRHAALVRSLGCELFDCRSSCPDSEFMDTHHLRQACNGRFTECLYGLLGLSVLPD